MTQKATEEATECVHATRSSNRIAIGSTVSSNPSLTPSLECVIPGPTY